MILAGVSLSFVLGDNGILKKSQESADAYKNASQSEQKSLQNIENYLYGEKWDSSTGDNNKTPPIEGNTNQILSETENKKLKDKNGNEIVVPAGFKVVDTGNLTVEKGIVVEDKKKNQYVWIPCTEATYQRTEWDVVDIRGNRASKDELTLTDVKSSDTDKKNELTNDKFDNVPVRKEVTDANLIEIVAQVKTEKASVKKNGGYYIGRYEVGGSVGAEVIQANQTPRTDIKWSTAYDVAKKIGGGTGATTYLCSSYAWDTAIRFIQNNGFPNYATVREDSYNENWSEKNVTDATGNIIKKAGSSEILLTGKTTPKCNIYDMGGNVNEFTTEVMNTVNVVFRGGNYINSSPAGKRNYLIDYSKPNKYGFRATLFLK